MEELKIDGIILKFNEAEKFNRIKEHMESCSGEEHSDAQVVQNLLSFAISNYNFI